MPLVALRPELAHDVMGRQIDPSLWTHSAISHSGHGSTTGVTGCGIYYPVCRMVCIKVPNCKD